jgi:polysaccharide export outer membrane protein
MTNRLKLLMPVLGLVGCLVAIGCQGVSTPVVNPTPPGDFFQHKGSQPSSSIRLVSANEGDSAVLPQPQTPENREGKIENQKPATVEGASDTHSSGHPSSPETASFKFACYPAGAHNGEVPRELTKVVIPDYVIEPPDILLVEAIPSLPDQPVQGEHLVRPDGTINLGTYGSVRVAGLTLDQARTVIKDKLSEYIKNVRLNVDVFAYNSKKIYIVADGGGFGEQVIPIPFTGNDTVLDAIGQIGGLPAVASKKKIWVARPGPDDSIQTLPVDWKAITQDGLVSTNYQLFPGDRIYIASDRLIVLDAIVTKIVTPMERVIGVTYLGARTVWQLQNMGRGTLGGGGF